MADFDIFIFPDGNAILWEAVVSIALDSHGNLCVSTVWGGQTHQFTCGTQGDGEHIRDDLIAAWKASKQRKPAVIDEMITKLSYKDVGLSSVEAANVRFDASTEDAPRLPEGWHSYSYEGYICAAYSADSLADDERATVRVSKEGCVRITLGVDPPPVTLGIIRYLAHKAGL